MRYFILSDVRKGFEAERRERMKFDDEICIDISCTECPFNKGEDGCLLAKRLDEIEITPEPCEDVVPRTSVEYICRKNTVSTNPYEHKYHDKFIQFMDDPEISDFGRWQHSNGFNTALVAVKCDLDKVPSAQPDIARDIATIIENERDMRVILKNERTETHSCDYQRTETHDLVSREDAIDVLAYFDEKDPLGHTPQQIIMALPSVQPHRWTPVSEALPKDGVTVWVTIRGHDVITCEEGETLEQAIARISKMRRVSEGFWCDDDKTWYNAGGYPMIVQPVAWMPMEVPEPWRGEEHEL